MGDQILQGSSFLNLYQLRILNYLQQGLGTSTDKDAQNYFRLLNKHVIPFCTMDKDDHDLIDLAFSKKKVEERKEWLRQLRVCRICWSFAWQYLYVRTAWHIPRSYANGDQIF